MFKVVATAGLRPELERPGLLLPARSEEPSSERRCPADVYLPSWLTGSPAAFDFTVVAPQRQAKSPTLLHEWVQRMCRWPSPCSPGK